MYNGWMIPDSVREQLLIDFPPAYSNIKASHVTHEVEVPALIPDAEIVIIGHVDDGEGVEALVVTVDGSVRRPDGKIYHITLSVADGRESKESNDVLEKFPYREVPARPIVSRGFLSKGSIYITTPLTAL